MEVLFLVLSGNLREEKHSAEERSSTDLVVVEILRGLLYRFDICVLRTSFESTHTCDTKSVQRKRRQGRRETLESEQLR